MNQELMVTADISQFPMFVIPLNPIECSVRELLRNNGGKYIDGVVINDIVDHEICDIIINGEVNFEASVYIELCDRHFVDAAMCYEVQDLVRDILNDYINRAWGLMYDPIKITRYYRYNSVAISPVRYN